MTPTILLVLIVLELCVIPCLPYGTQEAPVLIWPLHRDIETLELIYETYGVMGEQIYLHEGAGPFTYQKPYMLYGTEDSYFELTVPEFINLDHAVSFRFYIFPLSDSGAIFHYTSMTETFDLVTYFSGGSLSFIVRVGLYYTLLPSQTEIPKYQWSLLNVAYQHNRFLVNLDELEDVDEVLIPFDAGKFRTPGVLTIGKGDIAGTATSLPQFFGSFTCLQMIPGEESFLYSFYDDYCTGKGFGNTTSTTDTTAALTTTTTTTTTNKPTTTSTTTSTTTITSTNKPTTTSTTTSTSTNKPTTTSTTSSTTTTTSTNKPTTTSTTTTTATNKPTTISTITSTATNKPANTSTTTSPTTNNPTTTTTATKTNQPTLTTTTSAPTTSTTTTTNRSPTTSTISTIVTSKTTTASPTTSTKATTDMETTTPTSMTTNKGSTTTTTTYKPATTKTTTPTKKSTSTSASTTLSYSQTTSSLATSIPQTSATISTGTSSPTKITHTSAYTHVTASRASVPPSTAVTMITSSGANNSSVSSNITASATALPPGFSSTVTNRYNFTSQKSTKSPSVSTNQSTSVTQADHLRSDDTANNVRLVPGIYITEADHIFALSCKKFRKYSNGVTITSSDALHVKVTEDVRSCLHLCSSHTNCGRFAYRKENTGSYRCKTGRTNASVESDYSSTMFVVE